MKIRNMNIGLRLSLAFGALIAAMLALSLPGSQRLNALGDSMQDITEVNDSENALAVKMRVTVSSRMIALRNVVLLNDPAQRRAEADGVSTLAAQYASERELRAMLVAHGASPEKNAALEDASIAARAAAPNEDCLADRNYQHRHRESGSCRSSDRSLWEIKLKIQT